MSAPRVFVSSTILDFADLRSALKHWLEELGYEALLSEYNDFTKPLDTDSYSACLAAIDSSDYFVLIIGGRRGGWYDEANRISITRAEYDHAYARFLATGRPRILTFVRRAVLDIKEDRKVVAKAVSSEPARTIVNATESKIVVEDPAAIFAFVDAVKRVEEMKAATRSGKGYPPGNWVHQFDEFRDVVTVLRGEFRMSRSLRRAALAANLKHELLENATRLLHKPNGKPEVPSYRYSDAAHAKWKGGMRDLSQYQTEDLTRLSFFLLIGCVGTWLSAQALDEAITSTEFMEWDAPSQTYRVGNFQRTLLMLNREIEMLRSLGAALFHESTKDMHHLFAQARDADARASSPWDVVNITLAPVMTLRARHINVVRLSGALLSALDGDESTLDEARLQLLNPALDRTDPERLNVMTHVAAEAHLRAAIPKSPTVTPAKES